MCLEINGSDLSWLLLSSRAYYLFLSFYELLLFSFVIVMYTKFLLGSPTHKFKLLFAL